MKRNPLLYIFLICFFLLPFRVWADAVGHIVKVEGSADISRDGQPAETAVQNMPVYKGDIIRTKSKSGTEIRFTDDSIIQIGENARIQISEYLFKEKTVQAGITLFRGKIRSIVNKTRKLFGLSGTNRFEVRTETAVVGVRGTDFISYHQDGISGAVFIEGKGYCYSLRKPELIREIIAGQAMTVSNAYTPPVIRTASDKEIQENLKDTFLPDAEKRDGHSDADQADDVRPGQKDHGKPVNEKETGEQVSFPERPHDSRTDEPEREDSADVFIHKGAEPAEPGGKKAEGEFIMADSPSVNDREAAGDMREAGGEMILSGEGLPLRENNNQDMFFAEDMAGPDRDTGPAEGENAVYDFRQESDFSEMLPPHGGETLFPQNKVSGLWDMEEGPDIEEGTRYEESRNADILDIFLNPNKTDNLREPPGPDDSDPGEDESPAYTPAYEDEDSDSAESPPDSGQDDPEPAPDISPSAYYSDLFAILLSAALESNGSCLLSENGYIEGEMKASGTLWSAGPDEPLEFGMQGIFHEAGEIPGYTSAWAVKKFYSEKPSDESSVSADRGMYAGFMAGLRIENILKGSLLGLFTDPLGNRGILKGTAAGALYTGADEFGNENLFFNGAGQMYPVYLPGTLLSSENAELRNDEVWLTYLPEERPEGKFISSQNGIELHDVYFRNMRFDGEKWDISFVSASGGYSGEKPGTAWRLPLEDRDRQQYWTRDYSDISNQEGIIHGPVRAAWIDFEQALTGIGAGEFAGTFDPAAHTWQAVEMWTRMETAAFLNMTATQAGREKLRELNIPAVEIGKTDLSGNSNALSVMMRDVTFFSYSTGDPARIWATESVEGNFRAVPQTGHSVNLSGRGLNAVFEVMKWDSQKWGAAVRGAGSVLRTDIPGTSDISFTGNAAGGYTGTESGVFRGTAGGVANPKP